VSCSFDRYQRLWDIKSGGVLGTHTNCRVPYSMEPKATLCTMSWITEAAAEAAVEL